MTPQELFAEGRLAEAIELQDAAAGDPAGRLFLVQLFLFAGRLADARSHLALIDADDPGWPDLARTFLRLIRAERRRTGGRRPLVRPEPPPPHARRRWLAVRALREARPDDAVRLIDRADAVAPEVRGFLDGREFEDLRDADDRFASVLEGFVGGEYLWFPWEGIRSVRLEPANYARDRLFRPATVRLTDGGTFAAHVPLVYPNSHAADGVFATGLETDFVCPDGGPTRCVGGKLLLVGDGAEVPLADVTMIEIRPA
jgi:type VI secretion system protein ImpE